MNKRADLSRRRFLARALGTASATALAGCDALSRTQWFPGVLDSAEKLTEAAHHLLVPRRAQRDEIGDGARQQKRRQHGDEQRQLELLARRVARA